MSKGLIFFCCACAILIFTIINLSVGPIVSGTVKNLDPQDWGTLNCKLLRDNYDNDQRTGDEKKYGTEWLLNECDRKKGMHDMEYTSFIFNMVIGFVSGLLGLLHLFDVKKEFVSKTGLIGLGCGIVGFIFSFVYVILNGLVFTTVDTDITKIDSDRKFAEIVQRGVYSGDPDVFKCIYFEKGNKHAYIAKVSDFIKKQYIYDKDLYSPSDDCSAGMNCDEDDGLINFNPSSGIICNHLYSNDREVNTIILKDIFDRFLTTLLLSLFTCLANIGLAIFGFLLFRTPSEF